MSAFKHTAFIKSYKRRLQKKLDDVVEEAENACAVIHELAFKLKQETEFIFDEDDETFSAKYSKLQYELENFSEKLFLCSNILAPPPEECNKQERPKTSDLKLPISHAGSSYESQKESSSQASDITPSTDSGICVKSHSNGLESSEEKTPLNEETVPSSPPPTISEDESYSIHNTQGLSVYDTTWQTSYTSRDTLSSFSDHDRTHSCSSSADFDKVPKINDDKCLSEMSANSAHSFASANSHLDSSYKSVIESSCPDLLSQDVLLRKTVAAPIVQFHNPSDFWLQLENSEVEEILKLFQFSAINPADIRKNMCCIAPSDSAGFHRAMILSVSGSGTSMQAEVMFIDTGDLEMVEVSELCEMPKLLYEYPPQAIHCYLQGVIPVGNTWSTEAIGYFEDVRSYSDFEATILEKQNNMYGVQLTVNVHMIEEEDSYDMAQMLCLLKFAVPEHLPVHSLAVHPDGSSLQGFQSRDLLSYALNAEAKEFVSHDFPSTASASNVEIRDNVDSPATQSFEQVINDFEHLTANDSFRSSKESFQDNQITPAGHPSQVTEEAETCTTPEWDLNVVLPSPQPLLLDDDMMIVIPSVIYSPSHFYCNVAMVNSLELDELRDTMTNTYNDLDNTVDLELGINDIKEKMFLACSFDDGYWYRVQVDYICDTEVKNKPPKIAVMFVDYGNKKRVNVKDLRPLKSQFAKYPILGIQCSLAYIKPKSQGKDKDKVKISYPIMKWDKRATRRFRELVGNEKVLTVQMSQFRTLHDNRVLHEVFLWDTSENGDRMINDVLVEEGFAEYTNNADIIPDFLKPPCSKEEQSPAVQDLNTWNPMQDHFEDVLNSYGVDETDVEIATVGYKATDESYICKFYSNNGICYRGDRCPYKHIPAGYRGETQDQEAIYAFDNVVTLPNEGAYCVLQVSCIVTAGHFYVIFPFGIEPITEAALSSGFSFPKESEFAQLVTAMKKHYSKSPFDENTAIAPACGAIVAAKSKFDDGWYRARIREVEDVGKPVEVFYVDFGSTEWVDRRNVRQLLPEFSHCPFQAVEAFLANVDPPNGSEGARWTSKATSAFEKLVMNKTLIAYINRKIGSVLFVTLKLSASGKEDVVNKILVHEGHARFSSQHSVHFSGYSSGSQYDCMAIGPG